MKLPKDDEVPEPLELAAEALRRAVVQWQRAHEQRGDDRTGAVLQVLQVLERVRDSEKAVDEKVLVRLAETAGRYLKGDLELDVGGTATVMRLLEIVRGLEPRSGFEEIREAATLFLAEVRDSELTEELPVARMLTFKGRQVPLRDYDPDVVIAAWAELLETSDGRLTAMAMVRVGLRAMGMDDKRIASVVSGAEKRLSAH